MRSTITTTLSKKATWTTCCESNRSAITAMLSNGSSPDLLSCDDACRPRNLRPIVSNENEPATKKDLAELAADLTADLTTKLASKDDLARMASKDDLAHLAAGLTSKLASKDDLAKMASKDELVAMEKRLLLEIGHAIGHAANVMIEQVGAKVAVIDEKYNDPMRQVRADLDAHRADSSLHMRPAPTAPKRARRRKPLRRR